MRVAPILFVVALIATATACDTANDRVTEPVAGDALSFRTIDTGSCLEVADRHGEAFRTAGEWEAFWNDHVVCSDAGGAPLPPPSIANDEMLIAAFWGSGYSGCSNALGETIEGVRLKDGMLIVEVGPLPKPPTTCTALVYPMHVVATKRSDLPVVFDWP